MTAARIILVIPPGLPGTTPNREGASCLGAVESEADAFRYPPHTVATVAAVLRHNAHDVRALDAVTLGYDLTRAVRATVDAAPALVGIFVSWATRDAESAFLAALRRELALSVPVVAFGASVRHMHAELAEADYLLEGEPELAFAALCTKVLRDNARLPRVLSPQELRVSGYDSQGWLTELDALPFPAWDLMPVTQYTHLSVLSSRGCEGQCSWCPYVVAQGSRFRACSPNRVVAELREVVSRYHPRRIVFRDPAFAHDGLRVEAICRRIIGDRVLKPGKALVWECESRPEHLERRLLRLMSLAGCIGIKIGLETTDADLLCRERRVERTSRVARYLARVASLARDCARLGIACRVFVLAGLPGQSLASARETAGFVCALQPDALSVKVFKPYPGLPISGASGATVEEIDAQREVLSEAQQSIAQRRVRRLPRWRRALERLVSRTAALLKVRSG